MHNGSLALLTDLYQLSMAYCYWKENIHNQQSVFYHFFRRKPFKGEFAIACGLKTLIDFINDFSFQTDDLDYLASLKDIQNQPLFSQDFLNYLSNFSFELDIDAVEEGSVVFPYEPLIRVKGPILHAQLLESPLLNIINFQTLIATKAVRMHLAANGDEVVEFGMRRAQGIDGAITASRAAFIGGCSSTSNVIAGKLFGIPVKGTQAHSWIMCFDSEEKAFEIFSKHMPGNCVFLIDTYDSIQAAQKVVKIAKGMQSKGLCPIGVRLDSGDLATLSKKVRSILDAEGCQDLKIMASNELDEWIIQDLKHQGAKIDIWGVGTSLVTAKDQPALDGVYKLSMIQDQTGKWIPKMKLTNQLAKVTTPGELQIRRFYQNNQLVADMIYDLNTNIDSCNKLYHPVNSNDEYTISSYDHYENLLKNIFAKGQLVYTPPSIEEIQKKCHSSLRKLPSSSLRFLNPEPYFVGLEKNLYHNKLQLIKNFKDK